jgi:putative membrane protein
MHPVLQSILAGLPYFLGHFLVTLGMLGLSVWIYTAVTPHRELALVRAGNGAAAVSLAGAVMGLAIPLAVCLAGSVSMLDIVLWGLVILAVQVATYLFVDFWLKGLSRRIENDEVGAAVLLAGVKLSVAAINAAAIAG